MIWNSLNDPLFGWWLEASKQKVVSDNRRFSMGFLGWWWHTKKSASVEIRRSHVGSSLIIDLDSINGRPISLHGGPPFRSGTQNLQNFWNLTWILQSLCIYDGMLSLVQVIGLFCGMLTDMQLSHGALLADITVSESDRVQCNMYNSIASAVGSNSVFIRYQEFWNPDLILLSHMFWNRENLYTFRYHCLFLLSSFFSLVCIFLALIALLVFQYTASTLDSEIRPTSLHSGKTSSSKTEAEEEWEKPKNDLSLKLFSQQIRTQKNFWIFVYFNLVQVTNCHFNSNFFSIFMDRFLGGHFSSPILHSIILTSASLGPHLLVVLIATPVKKYGVPATIELLLWIKVGLAFCMYWIGYSVWQLVALYLLLNKLFSECICRHGNIIVADLVDEGKQCSL